MKKECTVQQPGLRAGRRTQAATRGNVFDRYPRLFRPLTLLAAVYSHLLEEPIGPGRTLRLVHAQVASMLFIFPVNLDLCVRFLFLLWAAAAIRQCRR